MRAETSSRLEVAEGPPAEDRIERRRYPRINGSVRFRRPRTLATESVGTDLSQGGMRVHWNEPVHTDELLELEVFFDSGGSIVCPGRVAWVHELPLASPARYEAGIEFLHLSVDAVARIEAALQGDSPSHLPRLRGLRKFAKGGPQVRVPHSTPGDLFRLFRLSRIVDLFRSS